MNLNGSDYQPDLIVNLASPRGIAIDAAGGRVYWTEQTGDRSGRIRRANLDGSNVRSVKELTSVPQGLALDTANGTLYLTNSRGEVEFLGQSAANES
jgi:DNA-binding beta-propeller fold protein YncE